VHGTLFVPAGVDCRAAVLLIGGSGGSEPLYVGEELASEGIAALSVAYFARPGLPDQLRGICLEYFVTALQILKDELASPCTRLAVLGISRGSEAANVDRDPLHRPRSWRGGGSLECRGGKLAAGRPGLAAGGSAAAL
jgi:hypothetical protein